jgi:homoaconitase/3-isopropylmalate dehydratase large subunit
MPLHHLGNVNHELDQRRSAIILCLATPSPSPGGIHDASRWTPESKTFQVRVDGPLRPGVSAKDIILALIARIGVGGGTGSVVEYTGSAIRALDMEERMTVCNMSIEAGARAGLVAPDDTTFQYLGGRPHAPKGAEWDAAVARWKELPTECIGMNPDQLTPGQYSASTSNRNFEGRQGKGGRTFLASPLTAAASAITGVVTDVRTML